MDYRIAFDRLAAEWSRSHAQQVLMVADGLRRCCRLRVKRDRLPRLAEATASLSVKMLVGFDALTLKRVEGRADFSEWARRAHLSPQNRGDCYVYLCRDHLQGQRLRRSDEAGDNASVGGLLDYPDCCIKAFGDLLEHAAGTDPIMFSYGDEHDINWPMNVSLFCFDRALLSHVPCSPSCAASGKLAERYYEFIASLSAEEASALKKALSTRVLYTRALGVAAFTAVESDAELEVEEVCAVDPESVLGKLLARGSAVARNGDGVSVDNCFLASSEARLFNFSDCRVKTAGNAYAR